MVVPDLYLSEMQLPVSFVTVLFPFEEALGRRFLASRQSFGDDIRQATLAEHL